MAPDLLIFPFQPENAPKVCKQLEVKGKGCPPPPLRKEAIREAAAEGTRPAGRTERRGVGAVGALRSCPWGLACGDCVLPVAQSPLRGSKAWALVQQGSLPGV